MEDAAAGLIETLLRDWFKDKSGFVPAIEAQKFVAVMREQHPTEFVAWLQEHAELLVLRRAVDRARTDRKYSGTGAASRTFQRYAAAMERGEDIPEDLVGALKATYRVNGDNLRRSLADMTAADLRFAARERETSAKSLRLEAAFLHAIAKRLPDDKTKVGDVFDEHQVYEIRKKLQPKTAA